MKTYLGDGLYADFDGYQVVLTAENGICATDTVYLEPSVYMALIRYVDGGTRIEEVKKNANLVCAATEMLAILKIALNNIYQSNCYGFTDEEVRSIARIINVAEHGE